MMETVSASSSRIVAAAGGRLGAVHDRHAGHEVFHDRAEDDRLEVRPVAFGLGDGDEIGAEKDAADIGEREEALGERRIAGFLGAAELGGAGAEDLAAGEELQARRIGRGFCLDEHDGRLSRGRGRNWLTAEI